MTGAKIAAAASLLIVVLIALYIQLAVAVAVPAAAIIAYNATGLLTWCKGFMG
jgi:hypothetical protein